MNTHEIKDLLQGGADLEKAVKELSRGLCSANKTDHYATPGLEYVQVADSIGFGVRLHGITLLPRYEQLKDGAAEYPRLFARVSLCLPDAEGRPGELVHSILINLQGHFSIDGSKHFEYSADPQKLDHSRHRLSCAIGEAIQTRLQVI
ncbi:hypothetical protein PQR64_26580 [Paraburkholderia phytofirmans]|uniref:hypothetical protein n=1 Tax=Paraburkholderia phytofirmans TaxID=261302 RepID=UPI0038BCC84D